MWNEPSTSFAESSIILSSTTEPVPAIIESVEPGSIGDDLGIEAGDKLISVNGIKPRDLIDYRYLIVEEKLCLEILDKNNKTHTVDLEKDLDQSLGLVFTEALFDKLKQCNNQCPFCFIDQQPPGKRKTLYIKDDDFRMSFLYGSYLTLTNLNQSDWKRIQEQRLSPLFVSIHSTDPSIRSELLKNQRAGLIMEQIEWFSKNNLQFHAQVVVCPGLNDGKALEKTLNDLFHYGHGEWPTVLSAAVVPVGLTHFRPENDGLIAVSQTCAKKTITQIERLQTTYRKSIGSNFAWLSDEWYLLAEQPLPNRASYENLPQEENGVGSIRSFLEEMDKATLNLPKKIYKPKTCSWVVGKLVEKALKATCNRLNEVDGLSLQLFGLPSIYWGQDKVVTGLLTGQDLIEGLKRQELGDILLLPSIMLKHEEEVFLDDMELSEVSKTLDVNIEVVYSATDFVSKAIGKTPIIN